MKTISSGNNLGIDGNALRLPVMLVLIAMAGGCTTNSWRESLSETTVGQDSLLSVSVTDVTDPQSATPTTSLTGIVKADKTSNLHFGRGGRIAEISISVGDLVSAEQLLATLDQSGLLAQKEKLEAVQKELVEMSQSMEAPAAVNTRQRLAQLQLELDRLRSEFENSADSPELSDQVKSLEKQVELLDQSGQQQQLQELQKKIATTEGELEQLDAELNRGKLIAPYDGVITKLSAFPGTSISPEFPVMQIASADRIVQINLPDAFASRLKIQQEIDLETQDEQFTGSILTISPAIDTKSRTRSVVIEIPEQSRNRNFVIGEIVTARIPKGMTYQGMWLPLSALSQEDRGLWSVFVVDEKEDHAVLISRTLKILHTEGNRVLVEGDLKPGDRVVSNGVHRLIPGQKVKIDEPSMPAGLMTDESGEPAQ